jgi:hypothetical protein
MRALFFNKRCGGVFWRCGHCGEDQELTKPPDTAIGLCRQVRDTDKIELVAPGCLPLLLGSLLVAFVCPGCARPVREALGQLAPRSLPDVDTAANLLGDF